MIRSPVLTRVPYTHVYMRLRAPDCMVPADGVLPFVRPVDSNPALFYRALRETGCDTLGMSLLFDDAPVRSVDGTLRVDCSWRKIGYRDGASGVLDAVPCIASCERGVYVVFYRSGVDRPCVLVPSIPGHALVHPQGLPPDYHERRLSAYIQSNIDTFADIDQRYLLEHDAPPLCTQVSFSHNGRSSSADLGLIAMLAQGIPSSPLMPLYTLPFSGEHSF